MDVFNRAQLPLLAGSTRQPPQADDVRPLVVVPPFRRGRKWSRAGWACVFHAGQWWVYSMSHGSGRDSVYLHAAWCPPIVGFIECCSVCPSVCLSVTHRTGTYCSMFIWLCLSISLSICLSFCVSVCLSPCLYVCLCDSLSICLSVCVGFGFVDWWMFPGSHLFSVTYVHPVKLINVQLLVCSASKSTSFCSP